MASGIFTLRQVLQGIRQGAWTGNIAPKFVEYLVVAGGGGGGGFSANYGGGGGAGGLLAGVLPVTPGATITVTVGGGGTGGGHAGTNGTNSVFSSITSTGGGGGSSSHSGGVDAYALSGGSGGGSTTYGEGVAGGSGVVGQGNAGGTSGSAAGPGGGGGAGTIGLGGSLSNNNGGNGGAGIASAINGTVTPYAGGGGAGVYSTATAGIGGVGGGGTGGVLTVTNPVDGTDNTGGGGGGAGYGQSGANGGKGIVIVRYPGSTAYYTGGTVWAIGGYVVHRFLSTGTLAPTTPTAATAAPTTIGEAFQGGYYAGMIAVNGSGLPTHYLVVSDVTVGESLKKWGPLATTTTITSVINGPTNSAALAALGATYAAATFCEALNTGGYTDWYMPAKNELEVCYYFLKPSADLNDTTASNGSNANAVAPEPISQTYTSGAPPITANAAWQNPGGAQHFRHTAGYWASTEFSAGGAIYTYFQGGSQGSNNKDTDYYVRAVRRVAI